MLSFDHSFLSLERFSAIYDSFVVSGSIIFFFTCVNVIRSRSRMMD